MCSPHGDRRGFFLIAGLIPCNVMSYWSSRLNSETQSCSSKKKSALEQAQLSRASPFWSNACSWSSVARQVRRQALREEFPHQIRAHASRKANGGIGEDQVCSPIRFRVVQIGQCSRAHIAEQIR